MKAITLTQPWATLVAIGAKRLETRSWHTAYRGSLAIHAAKALPRQARDLALTEPFYGALWRGGFPWGASELPFGCVIATCELFTCSRVTAERHWRAFENYPDGGFWLPPDEPELAFGDYRPGRWAWALTNIQMLPEPVPARGLQMLWEWTP